MRSLLFANVFNGLLSCHLLVSMRLFVSAHDATCSKTSTCMRTWSVANLCSWIRCHTHTLTFYVQQNVSIIWTNAGILLIGPLGNFSGHLIEILKLPFTKMRLKVLSAKWRPFFLGLNVLMLPREHLTLLINITARNAVWALQCGCGKPTSVSSIVL